MTKIETILEFKTPYEDMDGVWKEAKILLQLNYADKDFYITDEERGRFLFSHPNNSRKSKALLNTIGRAIDYANEELGFL